MPAEGAGKAGVGRLRQGEIARLQSLTDSLEILGAIGLLKWLSILTGAALAECGQGVEVLLRCTQVAGFEVRSELRKIGVPLLPEGLHLLVDRRRTRGCGGTDRLPTDRPRAAEVYNRGRSGLRCAFRTVFAG